MANVSSTAGPPSPDRVDAPSPSADGADAGADGAAPVARPGDSVAPRSMDAWLAGATREYESGWIDQPLWAHCLAQSDGDEEKTKAAYLRTRAIALQIAKRDDRSKKSERRSRTAAESAPPAPAVETGEVRLERAKAAPTFGLPARIVLGAMIVIAGIGFVVMNREMVAEPPASMAADRRSDPGASARSGHAGPASANAGATRRPEAEAEGFEAKVAKLSDAGNWNVLVLYASEWTRKEPANVSAWIQLSIGYAALRQFDDALEAATKAAQLAPDNPRVWRNLGHLNMVLDEPADALRAFEQAVALDDQDAQSLVQVGLLSAHLARLPEARAAFDKALSVSPDDVGALCGQLILARQQGRPQEADAITSKLQSLGRTCRDANESISVAVTAHRPPASKSNPRVR